MWSIQANGLFFLLSLIVFIGVGAQSNSTNETQGPSFRTARATDNGVTLSTPEECIRPCEGATPLYCYYQFRLEYYTTMGPACNQCRTDSFARWANRSSCQCIIADGFEKTVFSINRQFPGPSIQVCQYDKVIVDVHNAAEGTDTTIHWHGVFQNSYQYYDGVPHVTQCPISAPNTFRYQFSADNAGTHFYHSHSATFLADGQQGSLIVREANDPNKHTYDFDQPSHLLMLSDWIHALSLEKYPGQYYRMPGQRPDNFLINGHGDWTDPATGKNTNTPLAYFQVQPGKRYRFRLINSFATVCVAALSIEGHNLTVIATDGESIKPIVVDTIMSTTGERYDFVVTASTVAKSYWIQVRGLGECAEAKLTQSAVLIVGNALELPRTTRPTYDKSLPSVVQMNSLNYSHCMDSTPTNHICVNQLKSAKKTPQNEQAVYPTRRLYLPFSFFTYDEKIFKQNLYYPFYVAVDRATTATMISNISYGEPPSPLISQYDGYEKMCDAGKVSTCTRPCVCTHVVHMPNNMLSEIMLCDNDPFPGVDHPFHLHGYSFQVMALKDYGGRKATQAEIGSFIREYDNNLAKGRYVNQARKDTLKLPSGGCGILRFFTNNPGWWFFHCHFAWHTMSGMNVILHVGEESDLPPVPDGFPVCGNYVPSVYI